MGLLHRTDLTDKRTTLIFLVLLLLLATLLRFYGLDAKSLWQDEITTLKHATSGGILDVISNVLNKGLPAPPLHFVLIHLVSFLGDADFLLRFPSAIFGILAVAAVYNLGKALFGRTEGLLGAFLLTLSPFHVRYSQEARAYALFMLLSVLALFFLWKGMGGHEKKWWVGFTVCNILNLYTHLFALLVLVAEGLIFLSLWLWGLVWRRREVRPRVGKASFHFWGSMAIIMVCYLPMMPYLWQGIRGGKGLGGVDFTPGISVTPGFFVQVFSLFGAGSGVALLLFAVLFLAGLAGAFKKNTAQALLALLWIGVPFVILFAFPAKHGFRPRYLIFIVPIYLILIAIGTTMLRSLVSNLVERHSEPRLCRFYAMWLVFSLLLFGLLGFSSLFRYYVEPRADWRAAAAFLVRNVASGEVVYSPRALPGIALAHYRPELLGVQFIRDRDQRVDPTTLLDNGGVWIVAAGQSALALAEEVRDARDEPILEVVFGVDQDLARQAIEEGIAPAMFKEIWIAYLREGVDVEELVALYEDALSLASAYDSVGVHNSIGELFLKEGRIEEAILHYREAVRLDPDAPQAHYGLARAYGEKGWSQLAAQEWEMYTGLKAQ